MKTTIKVFSIIMSLVLCLFSMISCSDQYSKIKPNETDLQIIGNIKDYSICFDELRFAAINAKKMMSQSYGVDWSNENDVSEYRDKLSNSVFSGLKYNYAVQLLFRDSGNSFDDPKIERAVQDRISELIDACGGRKAYIEYLHENCLTDRVLRFNLAVSFAVNELIYILCDNNVFDEYGVDFDIEAISVGSPYFNYSDFSKAMELLYSGNIVLRTEHIYVPMSLPSADIISDDLYKSVKSGISLSNAAESIDHIKYETLTQVKGERDPSYYEAAEAINENDIALVCTESGYYIIKRMELDPEYLNNYYFELIYTYVSLKTGEHISAYQDTIDLTLTDFGKSIDLVKLQ